MDWDKFTFDFNFKLDSLFQHFVEIEAYKEAAINLVLPPDWKNSLDRLNRVRAIHGTTALEGNPLSESEVSHQIDLVDEKVKDGNHITKEQMQIRNSAIAQDWVRQRFAPGTRPLTSDDILKMHLMITQGSDVGHNEPGKLRSLPVTVGSEDMGGVHRGAPHNRLKELMEGFVDFMNSKRVMSQYPVVRALLGHFFLVTIHPFGDGNGRASRLLEAGILFQGNYNVHGFYGLSNYFYQYERDYKTLLQSCRGNQPFDVTPFIDFGLRGFALELKGINNFIKSKLNRVVYRQMMVRTFNKRISPRRKLLNQREWNLLDFLLTATEPDDPFAERPSKQVTFEDLLNSPYVRGAYGKVKPRTFSRELSRLASLGFITFRRDEGRKDWILELDFGAIGKHSFS